jgi:DNA-binding transcriptional MerR regulator
MKTHYSVKQLSKLAGVSVRTLHLYDKLGLLKPLVRTDAGYRLYGEQELLRLQQVLFYKELDLPLKEICRVLDDPDFDLITALKNHKQALKLRKDRIGTLLVTIDKTIVKLKTKKMTNLEELYDGLSKEQAQAYHDEAVEKWGEECVTRGENALWNMKKNELEALKKEQKQNNEKLLSLVNEDPKSKVVQDEIAKHYAIIGRFWGTTPKKDHYKGLVGLYLADERFTIINGQARPEYGPFMKLAIDYFVENGLE